MNEQMLREILANSAISVTDKRVLEFQYYLEKECGISITAEEAYAVASYMIQEKGYVRITL